MKICHEQTDKISALDSDKMQSYIDKYSFFSIINTLRTLVGVFCVEKEREHDNNSIYIN